MDGNLKTVTICCDFLMTRNSTQKYHLKWFYLIIERALSKAIRAKSVDFLSDNECHNSFQRSTFFALSGQSLPLEESHVHFNAGTISEESFLYLKQFINNTFVIGYELSEQTKEILDAINIKYVDIWLHPIRFLDDNFYAYSSSDGNILEKLWKYNLPDDTYYLYADKLKIQSYMGWDKFYNAIDKILIDDSCLFVGQTLTDKAVCRDGTMLTVLNFEEEFTQLTKDYSHVYFSPHPMIRGDYTAQLQFLNQFDNVSIIKEPGYKLLCSEKIKKVVAISSSLVYEAKFFNKDTEFLYRPIVPVSNECGDGGYISIFNKLHSSVFWANILECEFETKENIIDIDYLTQKNNYRDMLSLYYNNKVFDKEHFIFESNKVSNTGSMKPKDKQVKTASIQPYFSNMIAVQKIREMMKKYKVVSLDIFDTVLQRKVSNPGDIPLLVAKYANKNFSISVDSYINARKKCKEFSSFTYETPLSERYKIMSELLSIPEKWGKELYDYEMELDFNLIEPRQVGIELIKVARELNTRIVLASDIYYDRDFVIKLLDKCSIDYDELFVSSEIDKTKESGSLYDVLIEAFGSNILHIGDNRHSDYNKAKDKK